MSAGSAPLHPLRRSFGHFLRRRRALASFSRHPLLSVLLSHGSIAKALPAVGDDLTLAAQGDASETLERLQSSAQGLTRDEASRRLARDGANELQQEQALPWWLHLWRCYLNPFNLLLTALAVLSGLTADAKATVVIGVMVTLSTGIRFIQESRSHRAVQALRAMVTSTATVLRRTTGIASSPAPVDIPQRDLVRGDVVTLSAGDMIPADCRLLTARDLFVGQAAMTGESAPVEKFSGRAADGGDALARTNLVFMGTNVVSGAATAVVVATGSQTYFGSLASRVTAIEQAPNAFEAGVNSVSWLLIRFALVMVPIVFVANGITKGDWLQAFLFALSVAVGLTPEMLPMIVTSTLAKGAVLLSRKKVIVKRLDAIQNFGAMDVLCTDKTGTLTQDKVALARHCDPLGAESREVLDGAFLNSFYQTGLKNLLDRAILDHVGLVAELKLEQDYRKVDEIPFDFVRRRMSVVVSERDDHHELICKGALAEILSVCSAARISMDGTVKDSPLDAAGLDRIRAFARSLDQQGLRVVAVAMKEVATAQQVYSVADECGLTLVGFLSFLDPPKDSAAPALARLAVHGIVVKVLTGDNEFVTAHVCEQVGLAGAATLSGTEIEAMDDTALRIAVEQTTRFAKLAPLHKERIVRALRANGHVVGFIGDGINDAPALHAADIGISVDSAVDIAKEAADIILLEKSLLVLDDGVIEGRNTFSNMLKYIRMTASSNFGNVLSVLVASAFLPFLPMLPLQLLVQNLLYDVGQTGIPFDNVDAELVAKPLKWNPHDIGRFMLFFGPVSSIFDILTFLVMWRVFHANTLATQPLFQSGWFVVGLLTQTFIVHMIRTPKLPLLQSRASAPLLLTTVGIMALGIWLPMGPFAQDFKLQSLPLAFFPWLAAILFAYCALTTIMKRLYVRHFGWQ